MHRWGNKKDMAVNIGDDPPYLSVGTEVSAKYKGAFCEAKVRKVVKAVKCKVQYKNESGSAFVNDEQIKGVLMAGASVEVKQPDKKDYIEGTIVKIQDLSQYTVVFDDGDIATLRRTALCLKSGRHFAESETLDQLPLTHPEHFSTPVVSGIRGSRRRDDMEDNSDSESKRERKIEREEDMGKVVCVEVGDKKKSKDNWFPGLIVAPNAQDSVKIDVEDEYLVRSFKDGRYYTVPKRETVEFTREVGAKVDHPTLKMAVEKAISFLDKDDLPPHWDREVLFGMADYTSESDGSDTDSTDDEPREEKDHFVAQLYKFMDDRSTPINKGPVISSKDVDLYKLFKIVNKLGGYNRVTNRNQWKSVAIKLGYTASQTNNVKTSYKKFLHNFEDFYRKLGCTMMSPQVNNKLRSRSSRPLIRDRDKALPEKTADKDENSPNSDESLEGKELQNGVKTKLENQTKDETDTDDKLKELKKENVKVKKEPNVESVKEDDKIKKTNVKSETPTVVKDSIMLPTTSMVTPKETKPKAVKNEDLNEDKPVVDKKSERKIIKAAQKLDFGDAKKDDKIPKTKATKLKCVEKRIKKNEVIPGIRTKRSLKERMKAIVKKLKMKSGVSSANEQDKKKQKSTEDLNKPSPQLYKLKNKEEILSNGTKTRKLSLGNDNRNLLGIGGGNGDRKSTSSSASGGNTSDGSNSTGVAGRSRKMDEDSSEGPKKKTYTRKKKDEDKFLSSSSDSLINQSIDIVSPHKTICIGDKLKVYYGPTHESKVTYEAKVMNKRYGAVTEYFVHYTGWNTRYDEWIRRSRIAEDLSWTPARDKLKFDHDDDAPSSQSSSQSEQAPQPSQPITKTATEKVKRTSISPVAKNRSKSVTKNNARPGRGAKSKSPFDVKGKKLTKDSETSDDSETESQKKQELQKTRSRTEKRKQKDEDVTPKDVTDQKMKKTPPLKRTRSGSLKSETKEEPTKKRKVTPVKTATKTSRANAIRNSIMKNLVGRKRIADKGKKLFKKKDQSSDKESDEFDLKDTDEVDKLMETDEDVKGDSETRNDGEKNRASDDLKGKTEEEIEKMNCEDTELVLKIKPFPTVAVILEDHSPGDDEVDDADEDRTNLVDPDDTGPPVLKKEVMLDDEVSTSSSSANQFLADSYLAENLEKQKLVKGKTKKETEEKSPTLVPKIFGGRSSAPGSAEKSTAKANCDAKEKTFFTSRIDKVETKKVESTDKDKKDNKLRNTFTSYLCMDKIDSIRKVGEKSPADKGSGEKSSPLLKSLDGDDIYEFKEPEPFEFRGIDDCTILHRRSTNRLFDDSPYKRPSKTSSSPSDSTKDEHSSKVTDETDTRSSKDDLIETAEKSEEKEISKSTEPEKSEKPDTSESTKTKDNQTSDVKEIEKMEGTVEKCESSIQESIETKITRILVSADSSSKDTCKIDLLNESSLYGDLPNEDDDDDDDLEEEKLIISEGDQPDDDASSESITNKNEISMLFVEFDDKEKTPETKLLDSSSKSSNIGQIDSSVDEIKKKKASSNESTAPKSSFTLPSKKDDHTNENVVSSSDKSIDDEISEKLRADENLDSDEDGSFSSIKSGSSFGNKNTQIDIGESDSVTDDKDSEYPSSTESSGATTSEQSLSKKSEHSRTLSSETITYSYKKKITREKKCESYDTKTDTSTADQTSASESNKIDLPPHDIINEIEIEVFTAAKKEAADQSDSKNVTESSTSKASDWHNEKVSDKEENLHKTKTEQDDDDGLLLCEETIPKSPEGKDPAGSHDNDLPYPGASGISAHAKKVPEKKMKKPQRPSVFSAPGTVFENTPPTTPEGSSPGNSPSEERSGFSSTSFSLNEKSSLNKDSSENDTYSDNSERSLRTKSATSSKKNSYDYDSYLKRKSDKDSFYKNDEPPKKRGKQSMPTSANESEKDDYSDEGNSPKSTSLSQKFAKSSYYLELDPDLDANQRIEVLEQKLQELRKAYLALKQELSSIDKRRKKLRRREREGRMMTRNEANSLL